MSKFGIDVSGYNGVIDWRKVKSAGCAHAVLKILRRDLNPDKQFAANINGCKAQGIPYSVYRYVYEYTEAAAKKAAEAAVALLRRHNAAPGTIVWWDVEDKSIQPYAKTTLTPSILAAQKVVEAAGYGFGVYCGHYWYKSVLDTRRLKCPFWIAAYGKNPVIRFGVEPGRKAPAIKHTLWGWQYGSRGLVPGCGGNGGHTDVNMIYGAVKPAKAALPTLRRGSRGDAVRVLQRRLNELGNSLAVDGAFGPATQAAVYWFQRAHGLKDDGIVGPKTWGALGV